MRTHDYITIERAQICISAVLQAPNTDAETYTHVYIYAAGRKPAAYMYTSRRGGPEGPAPTYIYIYIYVYIYIYIYKYIKI